MSGAPRSDTTDEELIARPAVDPDCAGGRTAASTLLGRHQARGYVWCHRDVGDPERALERGEP